MDDNSLTEHVTRRLSTCVLHRDPFEHFFLSEFFPTRYYETLLVNLPDSHRYANLLANSTLTAEHLGARDQLDLAQEWVDDLPDAQRAFWRSFKGWLYSDAVARAVLDVFRPTLQEQNRQIEEVSVEVQLIRHRAGYYLEPHSDLWTKLVVLLIYLPGSDQQSGLGTSLYAPKDPAFSCPTSQHHDFSLFNRRKTLPYSMNSVLGFQRSDRSFHGVEPLADADMKYGARDLLQYVLYDKPAREQQLRERAEAAS